MATAPLSDVADEPARPDELAREARFERRILGVAWRVAVAAVAVQTTVHLVNAAIWEKYQLNANNEGTMFAWASVVATFGTALAAAVTALVLERGRGTRFLVLAGLVAFLSLDDMVAVHERLTLETVSALGLSDTWDSVLFVIVYAPLLSAVGWLLYAVARDGSAEARRTMHWGLGMLLVAVAAEALSAKWSVADGSDNWVHILEGAFEEGAELAGWVLVASATIAIGARLAANRER